MYVCIYVHIYMCIHIYMYAYIYIYRYICVHMATLAVCIHARTIGYFAACGPNKVSAHVVASRFGYIARASARDVYKYINKIHIIIFIYIHACIYACLVYIYVYIHICIHIYICIYTYMYTARRFGYIARKSASFGKISFSQRKSRFHGGKKTGKKQLHAALGILQEQLPECTSQFNREYVARINCMRV